MAILGPGLLPGLVTHLTEYGAGACVMVRVHDICFLLFGPCVLKRSPSSGSQTQAEDPVLESVFPTVFQTGLGRNLDYILKIPLFEAMIWKNK